MDEFLGIVAKVEAAGYSWLVRSPREDESAYFVHLHNPALYDPDAPRQPPASYVAEADNTMEALREAWGNLSADLERKRH